MHRCKLTSHPSHSSQRRPHHRQRRKRRTNHKNLTFPIKIDQSQPSQTCPNLTIQFCHSSPKCIHELSLTGQDFAFQLQSKITTFNTFQFDLPSLTTVIPGATNRELSFSRFRRTIPIGLAETASKACFSPNPKR